MIISRFIFKCIVFVLYTFVFVYLIAVHCDPLAGWPQGLATCGQTPESLA